MHLFVFRLSTVVGCQQILVVEAGQVRQVLTILDHFHCNIDKAASSYYLVRWSRGAVIMSWWSLEGNMRRCGRSRTGRRRRIKMTLEGKMRKGDLPDDSGNLESL